MVAINHCKPTKDLKLNDTAALSSYTITVDNMLAMIDRLQTGGIPTTSIHASSIINIGVMLFHIM